jgi:NADP-dependent 3-hydroxy acid dehydrogenase YdfG
MSACDQSRGSTCRTPTAAKSQVTSFQLRSGHVVNVASVAAHEVVPTVALYCATKHAVKVITERLRQEHNEVRSTLISPYVVATELGPEISVPEIADVLRTWRKKSLTPGANARVIRYALEQPNGIDVNEIIVSATEAGI